MQGAILKAFTYENNGGNGAGVIMLDEQISNEEKQNIAKKIGLSETAFVKQIDEKNFDVSFFTPLCEVDLCGHATIATFYYLAFLGKIRGNSETKMVYQNTKVGKLEIEIKFNNNNVESVLMQQLSPKIYNEMIGQNKKAIAISLNIDENSIGLENFNIEPTVVSTGLKDIVIPVKTRKILNQINVNSDMIKSISLENDVVGYHVFTIDDGNIYARNFAPAVGIDEECATGTSNGALGSLLYKNGIMKEGFKVIQGESMNEASLIYVKIIYKDGHMDVRVGGKALVTQNYL